ncbi:hypothetical protein T459_22943 [Capsicum annuum]|uniref:Uncharacterized protein n=1 Tax=Capsicum annuum TaxID=4072 RepID=A0A2G2YQY5_CAPAN|nr:hypothetical protein T459_22943 [Capsicum annuum]
MATCTSDVFMLPDTRWPPKVLTVLDGRLCPLKIQDEKIGYSGVEFWIVNIDIQPPLMEVKLEEWLGEEDEGIPSIEPVAISDASRVQAFNSKALGTEGVL